jgi:uncharacterized protein YjbJ (UPF0337 family)
MNEKQPDQNEAQKEVARAAAQALDETFGAGTAWKLSGDMDKAVGHAKMQAGQVLDDPGMVANGIGLQAYATAEHVEGKMEHDYASVQAEIETAIAALKANTEKLNAESARDMSVAGGEASADMQAKMAAAKAKQQAIELRIKAALDQAQAETNAKVASLRQQAARATGAAKADIEHNIEQVEYDNQQVAEYLNKAILENTMVL